MGVCGVAQHCISSYLQVRKQYVYLRAVDHADGQVCSFSSAEASIRRGVPQGSVLGTVLFLLFISNLPFLNAKLSLYADHTSLLISRPNVHELDQIPFWEAN